MKLFRNIIVMILIISMIVCIIIFGWLNPDIVFRITKSVLEGEITSKIILGLAILFILLSLKCIFFSSFTKEESSNKDSILLENENGKLLVSRDTIESLTNTVVETFDSAESVMTKVAIEEDSTVKIYVTLFVLPNAVIKELSSKLQTNIKEAVKKSLDLDVTEVNIRIKNIAVKKEPLVKE